MCAGDLHRPTSRTHLGSSQNLDPLPLLTWSLTPPIFGARVPLIFLRVLTSIPTWTLALRFPNLSLCSFFQNLGLSQNWMPKSGNNRCGPLAPCPPPQGSSRGQFMWGPCSCEVQSPSVLPLHPTLTPSSTGDFPSAAYGHPVPGSPGADSRFWLLWSPHSYGHLP